MQRATPNSLGDRDQSDQTMQVFYAAYAAIGCSTLVLVACLLLLPPLFSDMTAFQHDIMNDVELFTVSLTISCVL